MEKVQNLYYEVCGYGYETMQGESSAFQENHTSVVWVLLCVRKQLLLLTRQLVNHLPFFPPPSGSRIFLSYLYRLCCGIPSSCLNHLKCYRTTGSRWRNKGKLDTVATTWVEGICLSAVSHSLLVMLSALRHPTKPETLRKKGRFAINHIDIWDN